MADNPWRDKRVIGGATLYLGDCLEILPHLPKVDAVITDPPYLNLVGTYERDYQGGVGRKTTITKAVGDEWGASLDWIQIAAPLATKAFMAFCALKSVGPTWAALEGIGEPIDLVTWHKRNSAPTGKNVPYYTTEFIWCKRLSVGPRWDDLPSLIDVPNINPGCMATERLVDASLKAIHPTQKPIAVMSKLLLPGIESVLDPFMGSGTTGVACMQLGRRFVGVEIEERYFNIAVERITNAQRQTKLFDEPVAKREQGGLFA